MRSREISSIIIIQNFVQLKALFKDTWETIPGNCDTFIYLGGNEQSTHKYVSELLGKGTIDKKSSGETKGRQGSSSRNYDVLGRELFTPDEVRKLDNKKCIIFIRGFDPIMDSKFIPFGHPAFDQTADGKGKPYVHVPNSGGGGQALPFQLLTPKALSYYEELKKKGVSIIYISHKMEEVFKISDDISVLRDGSVVSTDRAEDLDLDTVISRMVGRKIDNVYPKEEITIGEKALEVEHFTQHGLFEDVSFYARRGEIVGFAGLVGAGRTEPMRAVFGLDHHDSGTVKIGGQEVHIKSSQDSIEKKLVMLSESRRDDGIVPVRSVLENASLASLKQYIYGGYAHRKKETEEVSQMFGKMNVKTPSLETEISKLSGGNQQKVLLTRWMLCNPQIMILDEPTRGIDIGAKFEIYKLMTEIVKEGKAVIMVSSELPELLGMCDRIYVMCQGKVTGCIGREDFSHETIMRYAAGIETQG